MLELELELSLKVEKRKTHESPNIIPQNPKPEP